MLTTLEATLTTVHEIGHNFGAIHDEKAMMDDRVGNDEQRAGCLPSHEEGRHVMYGRSVNGDRTNNKMFSWCSRDSVGGKDLETAKSIEILKRCQRVTIS